MISLEAKGNGYLVRFLGKKQQFNEYINKIMKIVTKEWNLEKRCWFVAKENLELLQAMFTNIEYLDEVQDLRPRVATDFDDMGKAMKLSPYDYQKEAIKFGIDMNEILIVYPCGSGKTPVGIGMYLEARDRGIITGPGMIVVKASLKKQWQKEIEKFSDLKATVIQSPSDIAANLSKRIKTRKDKMKKLDKIADRLAIKAIKAEIDAFEAEKKTLFQSQFDGYDLFVLNYETLMNAQIRSEIHRRKINFIFADEIHYIKNREAKRSEALYEFKAAKMKIGATATPVGKNPEDLFGIFSFVCPSIFPAWKTFSSTYIKYAGFGRVSGTKNKENLVGKYAPHTIVKTKEEVSSQLPSLLVIPRHCDMTADQQEANQRIMSELEDLKMQSDAIRARCKTEIEVRTNPELMKLDGMILAMQTFAQEIADAPEMLLLSESEMAKKYACASNDSPKLDLLIQLVEEIIASDEKVCIFSKFSTVQSIITDRIHKEISKDIKIAYVNGGLSGTQRYREVYDRFRDDEDYKVLIMTDAGAEGLNLSKCKYLIEFDLAESYGIQTQRHGRVERSDSVHDTVFVYQLIADDSWDEIQKKIIEKKEGYDAELIKVLARQS